MAFYSKALNAVTSTLKHDWDVVKKANAAGKFDNISGAMDGAKNFGSTLWKGLGETAEGHSGLVAGGKLAGYGLAGMATLDFVNPFGLGWGD